MKISAVLIVKNEEEILAKALESVKGFDEVIVVDTGSTDKTIEIAKTYTDKIFNFPWIDDFSAARNFGAEKATGDWIFSIDADHELITPLEKIKEELEKAEKQGAKTVLVRSYMGANDHHEHWREVLFKKDPEVKWVGAVHECMTPAASLKVDVTRRCGYSGNHAKDPYRNIRILEANPKTTRSLFYLGRENYERRLYPQAIEWMQEFLKAGKWVPEIAEAWLVIARSYWFTQKGDKAREACLQAIKVNPDFKEALLFMGNMHYEPWKSKWHRLAEVATNKDVLFIRT
jgi:glycosyltransferase involved in cell wall biosynthesis